MVSLKFSVCYDALEAIEMLVEELDCDNLSVFENTESGFSQRNDENGFSIANRFDVEVLFKSKADASEFQQLLLTRLEVEATGCEISELSDEDWVDFYVKKLQPISCGKFYIFNEILCKDSNNLNLIPIQIKSALAFGSGHHQTTKACLLNLVELEKSGQLNHEQLSILDMGCGTGILGICAAKIWKGAELMGVDIDREATKIAQDNYTANDVFGTALTASTVPHGKFDLVLCNILKQPLIDMCEDFFDILKMGGYIIISGFILNQEDEIIEYYSRLKFVQTNRIYLDEWVSILLRKLK
ncbi:MAG: 50S ribosomal protein L11 methyltransferase [Holosporales bacterium]|jgi:ribosomal protein L11 methyltransferase|nr:50S ribosomal protein L11 methyltransferase [Holosporales bacterium]